MFRPRRIRPAVWAAGVLFVLGGFRLAQPDRDSIYRITFTDGEEHVVARAIDGDTLELRGGARVRLIGVDTPEMELDGNAPEPWCDEARAFTDKQVNGRAVSLTFDRERIDPYGRVLAYVSVDDRLLNEELIAVGLGRAVREYSYSGTMQRRFDLAEASAREAGLGIWSR